MSPNAQLVADRITNSVKLELLRIDQDRAFWERKYRALERYCFGKMIPQWIDLFSAITDSDILCRHDDIEVSLIETSPTGNCAYSGNGFWAKCRKCGLVITDDNGYPPLAVALEELEKRLGRRTSQKGVTRDGAA